MDEGVANSLPDRLTPSLASSRPPTTTTTAAAVCVALLQRVRRILHQSGGGQADPKFLRSSKLTQLSNPKKAKL